MNELELLKKIGMAASLEAAISALIRGSTKAELVEILSGLGEDDPENTRREIVSRLRSAGYSVTGGRGGGKEYRIIGWSKIESTDCTKWDEGSQEKLRFLALMKPLSDQDEPWFTYSTKGLHESSWLYVKSYELIGDRHRGVKLNGSVVVQKNKLAPQFRLVAADDEYADLWYRINDLATISTRPVRAVNITAETAKSLRSSIPGSSIEKFKQPIFSVQEIADHPESFWRSKNVRNMKSALRDTTFYMVVGSDELQTTIIDEWRVVNQPKHRLLAIGRDYAAITGTSSTKVTVIGIRDGYLPVSVNIFDGIGMASVAHIVEKSLNYSTMPGGRPGTTDLGLWQSCVLLSSIGIKWINAGQMPTGMPGLAEHKLKLCGGVFRTACIFNSGLSRS